jgi:hypothetical protein
MILLDDEIYEDHMKYVYKERLARAFSIPEKPRRVKRAVREKDVD